MNTKAIEKAANATRHQYLMKANVQKRRWRYRRDTLILIGFICAGMAMCVSGTASAALMATAWLVLAGASLIEVHFIKPRKQ